MILTPKEGVDMVNNITDNLMSRAEQSRAEQSRAEQSRALFYRFG